MKKNIRYFAYLILCATPLYATKYTDMIRPKKTREVSHRYSIRKKKLHPALLELLQSTEPIPLLSKKEFVCSCCGKSYERPSDYKRHITIMAANGLLAYYYNLYNKCRISPIDYKNVTMPDLHTFNRNARMKL